MYSSSKPNTPQTLKIKFDGVNWSDLSWIINNNTLVTWTPSLLDNQSQKFKIKNATDIRIFKKNSGWWSGSWWPYAWQPYSWNGCGSCPAWTYKTWSSCFGWHKYEKCSWIVWNNVCAEKSRCDRDDESWSWIYNP